MASLNELDSLQLVNSLNDLMSLLDQLRKRRGAEDSCEPYTLNEEESCTLSDVWMCGSMRYGRTGVGAFKEDQQQAFFAPVRVARQWKGVAVKQCAVGAAHSLALTEDGVVFSWGKCHVGQLGHGDIDRDAWVARQVERLTTSKVTRVGCGASSSFAVTEEGNIYGWGMGYYGALGNASESHQTFPVVIPGLPQVKDVCGTNFQTAFVCGEDRVLYVCGQGLSKIPMPVRGVRDVEQISAGGSSIAGVCSDGRLFLVPLMSGTHLEAVQVELPEGARATAVSTFDDTLAVIVQNGSLLVRYDGISWRKVLDNVNSVGVGHYGHLMAHCENGTIFRWGSDGGYGCHGLPYVQVPEPTVKVRNFRSVLCGSNMSLLHGEMIEKVTG